MVIAATRLGCVMAIIPVFVKLAVLKNCGSSERFRFYTNHNRDQISHVLSFHFLFLQQSQSNHYLVSLLPALSVLDPVSDDNMITNHHHER